MSLLRNITRGLRSLFRKEEVDRELDEELRAYQDMAAEEKMKQGMSRQEALRAMRLEGGSVDAAKEVVRSGGWESVVDTLWRDLLFAARMMRKSPGFTLVAILTLALGIGGNTAVFSVMNTVLLRYLPLPNPQQLVFLSLPNGPPDGVSTTGDDDKSFSYPVFEAVRKEHGVFSDLMAYMPLAVDKVAVRIGEDPEEAEGDMVSGNFFSGLGVSFTRGRGFALEDETAHASVVVLSYSYWTTRFGRSPSAIGQTIYVKGVPFTVIGVTAQGFYGIEPASSTDFWIPLQNRPELNAWNEEGSLNTMYSNPKWWYIQMIGRLVPSVTESQALAKLDPVFQSAALIGLGTPDPKAKKSILAFSSTQGIQGMRDDYQKPIQILLAMVGLVLAIACANVSMLLVARNSTRAREFSVRMALGAGRSHLLRQTLTESFLLVAGGASFGWMFAIFGSHALAAWSGMEIPFVLDSRVLLFTLAISIGCAIVFGLAPLRRAVSVPAGVTLKTSNATAYRDQRSSWSGKVVVASQMALCLVLLVGSGLLVRSLRNYQTLPVGLRVDGLLVFGTDPFSVHSDEEKEHFYQNLLARLRETPGVESATLVSHRLGSGWGWNSVWAIDGVEPQGPFSGSMSANHVGPDFCHTLGIPILRGRDVTDADTRSAPKVVLVNETFSKRFFPKGDALGHSVTPISSTSAGKIKLENRFTIVGVIGDSKYKRVDEKSKPTLYFPFAQYTSVPNIQVELRTSGDPDALIPSVRAVLHDLDPNLPIQKPITQRAQFEESYSQARLFARLSIFFGVIAVLLVATGLYGTLAYRVDRRTSEIGVRMALGAQHGQVLWLILRESLLVSGAAILAGVPVAIAGARLMRSMLFGVQPGDMISFLLALFGVILVALAASIIPARRAMRVDPMVALRYE
ncbi:MAG TPA: ABC transporter permease [Candidatus Methylomirabilis sp.]|nr:ABC transporter permease [Candidatus Methylomirabilis sp.]